MCKLCERDRGTSIGRLDIDIVPVRTDRLAVLERDHEAIERLRSKKWDLRLEGGGHTNSPLLWEAIGYHAELNITNDPAEAILVVKEKMSEPYIGDNDKSHPDIWEV